MNVNDTYHNTCNDQPSTWTIEAMKDDKVTVYSPQSDGRYIISQVIFEDTMRHLGFTLQPNKLGDFESIGQALDFIEDAPPKYKIWLTNYNRYFGPDDDYNSFDDALEAGKLSGANFQIRLGEMVCATWVPIGGLEFTREYKKWYQENERKEKAPHKYRIYYINHDYYSDYDFDYINRAIEYGKETGMDFRVELGSMVCCAWDAIGGLRFYGEYQAWKRDQEMMLGKTEGTYD